jgi:hypothetical protein
LIFGWSDATQDSLKDVSQDSSKDASQEKQSSEMVKSFQ